MTPEALAAKSKVRYVYPKSIFYRGWCGFDSAVLDNDKRPWNALSCPNHSGDAEAAWIDAASRLPSHLIPPHVGRDTL